MNKIILGIAAVLIIIGTIVVFSKDTADAPASVPDPSLVNSAPSLGTPAPQDDVRVVIAGHKIKDGKITVPVGTTVVFENKDSFQGLPYSAHTVTTGTIDPSGQSGVLGVVPNSGSGIPDGLINESLKKDGTYSYRFSEPGSVTFYIEEHPLVAGQGTVTVTAVEEMVVSESGKANEETAEEATVNEIITMNSTSFAFAPNSLNAKVGEKIAIDITSVGLHTFTIDELGVDVTTPHGKTTRVSFTPDTAGSFEYYCAIPGHREAGQVGSIIVSE